jgi:hypothetical protein
MDGILDPLRLQTPERYNFFNMKESEGSFIDDDCHSGAIDYYYK